MGHLIQMHQSQLMILLDKCVLEAEMSIIPNNNMKEVINWLLYLFVQRGNIKRKKEVTRAHVFF